MPEPPLLIDQVPRDRAITTLDRDILVAASAGTGKTTVLTERVLHALTVRGLDITRILVLTFTEAAAEEMRGRIARRLHEQCRSQSNPHLRRQQRRLDAAPISTIHAFCKRMLDTFFFRAGLDPLSQILDEDQGSLLLAACREKVLAAAWADSKRIPALRALMDGRNPDSLLDSLVGVFRFLEGIPNPIDWLAQAEADLENNDSHTLSLQDYWLKHHLGSIKQSLDLACHLDRVRCDGQYLEPFIHKNIHPWLDDCLTLLADGEREDLLNKLHAFTWPRLPGGRSAWSQEDRDWVKKPYEDAKGTVNDLLRSALLNPSYRQDYGQSGRVQGRALLDLVKQLRVEYCQAKSQQQVLDYADLEHHLLALLEQSPETAAYIRAQYDLILVDEYQDVNAVQQSILNHLRREHGFFAVGDVKQSIYGFRQARPTIFLNALEQADASNAPSLRLDLQTNFRCRPEIIHFANDLFARLFQPEMGGIHYDDRAHLLAGRHSEDRKVPVELVVLDNDTDGMGPAELAGVSDTQRQAAWLAGRIRALVEGAESIVDRDTGRERAVTYGDIVILMRSPGARVNVYTEILRLAGIPVSSQSSAGYFASMEVLDVLALLRVLDNPHQDVEFAAVLRSALLGLSDADLAEIRWAGQGKQKNGDFYSAARRYTQSGENLDLRRRLQKALKHLEDWRNLVRGGSLADMLWKVYRSTGYLSFVAGLTNGAQRRANLLKLHDRAMEFENSGGDVSLGGFVTTIEGLLSLRQDWAPAEPDSVCASAVRIMSVHRSKGLEFPIVFLADLEHRFNFSAAQGACLVDDHLGLGLAVVDAARNLTIKSPAHEVIAMARREQDLAEELRILYVAVTRARERLVLCGSMPPAKATENQVLGQTLNEAILPAVVLRSAGSVLEWLLYALPKMTDFKIVVFRDLQAQAQALLAEQRSLLETRRKWADSNPEEAHEEVQAMQETLAWSYPHAAAVRQAAKQSVSELSHRDDEFTRLDQERALKRVPLVTQKQRRAARGPSKTGIDARTRGTALHLIMETLNLEHPPQAHDVLEHARSLVTSGRLSEEIVATLDPEAISSFFTDTIGAVCFKPDSRLWREWPFTLAVPPTYPTPDNQIEKKDFVIVQGIVDLLIQRPEGVWVVDFKTDQLQPDQTEARCEAYRRQLGLYAQAATAILGQPILGRCLYFTQLKRTIQLD